MKSTKPEEKLLAASAASEAESKAGQDAGKPDSEESLKPVTEVETSQVKADDSPQHEVVIVPQPAPSVPKDDSFLLSATTRKRVAEESKKEVAQVKEVVSDDAYVASVTATLELCKTAAEKQKKHKMETARAEQLIGILHEEISEYRKGQKTPNEVLTLANAQKKKALDEIFHFYTKQYVISNIRKTFDGVNKELNRMEIGYFLKLLKDFRIPIESKRAKELFVKNASEGRNIDLSQFETLLEQVANELSKQTKERLEKELNSIKDKLKLENGEGETEKSVGTIVEETKGYGLQAEMAKIQAVLRALDQKKVSEISEVLYGLMFLQDVSAYRTMLEGFKRKAFNTSDVKTERIPHEMIQKYKTRPKEVTEYIKEKIAAERKLKNQDKTPVKKVVHTLTTSSSMSSIPSVSSKATIKTTRFKKALQTEKMKYTIQGLGRLSYKDLKESDGFDPRSLLSTEMDETEIARKFPLAGIAVGGSVDLGQDRNGSDGIKSSMHSFDKRHNSIGASSSFKSPKTKKEVIVALPVPHGKTDLKDENKKRGVAAKSSMANSIKKAMLTDLQNQAKVEKNLKYLTDQQDKRLLKGLGIAKKAKML